MRVFILSDVNNIHTKRWVKALAERGIDIFLFGFYQEAGREYAAYKNVQVYGGFKKFGNFLGSKVKYLFTLREIKRKIREFKPDIVHAHYASSYGLLGALTGFHPYIISVWGADVYDFPKSYLWGKAILRYNLKKADLILSTSYIMARETGKYTEKKIGITPFGVDLTRFRNLSVKKGESFVVGNVKTLSPKYGIDVLIRAFSRIVERNPGLKTELVIVGEGPKRKEYEKLACLLGLAGKVKFEGWVAHDRLPEYYNRFSVAVSVSVRDSESFGVVAVEAMACECPVVVSDADGFTEVVKDGETGFIVPKGDVEATAEAIQVFIDRPELRQKMGERGRKRVTRLYDWEKNVEEMVKVYNQVCLKGGGKT